MAYQDPRRAALQYQLMGNAGASRRHPGTPPPLQGDAAVHRAFFANQGSRGTDESSPQSSSSHSPFSRSSSQRLEVISKQATKVTAISTKLEWKIDQFEKLMKLFKNGNNLISRQFSCPQAPTVIWELHVYPNGKREEDNGNVSFFLRQVGLQRGEEPIMTEFQIYTNDKDGNRVSVCRDTKDFTNQQGRGKFQVQREKMMGALKIDGSLILICEVEYFPPGTKISVEQADESEFDSEESEERNEYSLRAAMRDMFESERLADCKIKVENKEFKAHRCILAQHSEVFRSMFGQELMIEAQKGEIDITDSRPEPVRAMLEFIYTGTTSLTLPEGCSSGAYQSDKQYAQDVLAIADKYAILSLKEQCERFLANSIDAKTIASTVVFADTYSANILRVACTRFIMSNQRDVIRSAEWKQLKRDRPDLVNGILEAILIGDPAGDYTSFDASYDDSTTDTLGPSTSNSHERSPPRKRTRRFAGRN